MEPPPQPQLPSDLDDLLAQVIDPDSRNRIRYALVAERIKSVPVLKQAVAGYPRAEATNLLYDVMKNYGVTKLDASALAGLLLKPQDDISTLATAPPATVFSSDFSIIVAKILQQMAPRQPQHQSPHQTPTTLGQQVMEICEAFFPIQDREPVLTQEQLQDIRTKLQFNQGLPKGDLNKLVGEHLLVRLLTPRLQEIFDSRNLRVVNSEDFPWLMSMGANLKPDLFLCPSWVYTRRYKSKATQKDQLCGTVPVKKLYDSVYLVDAKIDWKNEALGELVMHLSNLRPHCKGMLVTLQNFYLVSWDDMRVVKCVKGNWTDAGSKDCILEFFPPMKWDITNFLDTIGVVVDEPKNENDSAFLGAGGFGRVIRVRVLNFKKSENFTETRTEDCDLKAGDIEVSVDDSESVHCSQRKGVESSEHLEADNNPNNSYALKILFCNPEQLFKEYNILRQHQIGCNCSLIMKPVPDACYHSGDFSGMLLNSIGETVKLEDLKNKNDVFLVLSTLRNLHSHNPPYIHGDPRLDNLLRCDGKYVWIDLLNGQTICDQRSLLLFKSDLKILVDSLLRYELNNYPSLINLLDTYNPFVSEIEMWLQMIAAQIHVFMSSPPDALSNLKIE